MVSVLVSNALDRGFDPWSGKTKDYTIGMCCFSVKRAGLRRKRNDWLARNQDNVSEWGDMYVYPHVALVQNRSHHHLIVN